MAREFTRYQLRERTKALGIEVRYGQFATYIAKGLLPDPGEAVWTEEEIVPRFLRIHELEERARSLDRRVVILHLERYPVPPAKLRNAMAGMLPTITKPTRKMARIAAADRWFSATHGGSSSPGTTESLPADWRMPRVAEWRGILRSADVDVFAHRLGFTQYYADLLRTVGKGTPHALDNLDPEEKLVLLTLRFFAARQWWRQRLGLDVKTSQGSEDASLSAPTGAGKG